MDKIYSEMRERNLNNVQTKGFSIDNQISHYTAEARDPRRCLALSTFPTYEWSAEGTRLMETLLKEFGNSPDVVLYEENPASDVEGEDIRRGKLHWTLMQIMGFAVYPPENGRATQSYGESVEALSTGEMGSAFKIHYQGVIAVGTGLVLVGVCDQDINAARNTLREGLKEGASEEGGTPFMEPFVNNIVHSTILRFSGGDGQGEIAAKVLSIAKEFESSKLGVGIVDQLRVGECSWRMLECEIEDTPPCHVWQLAKSRV